MITRYPLCTVYYIAHNAKVSLKLAGNTAQVTFTAGKNKKCPIKNLSKDEFVALSTGEVKKLFILKRIIQMLNI